LGKTKKFRYGHWHDSFGKTTVIERYFRIAAETISGAKLASGGTKDQGYELLVMVAKSHDGNDAVF
jgi:hypothetical protein